MFAVKGLKTHSIRRYITSQCHGPFVYLLEPTRAERILFLATVAYHGLLLGEAGI